MPNFQTGNFKQKNKKFKGGKSSSKNKKFKEERTKKIKKQKNPTQGPRQKTRPAKKLKSKNINPSSNFCPNWPQEVREYYEKHINSTRPVKIVLVFSLNEFDSSTFVNFLLGNFCRVVWNAPQGVFNLGLPLVELNFSGGQQQKSADLYYFIPCPRNDEWFLDYCKVADILINLSSVEYVDLHQLNVKPQESMHSIDPLGIKSINLVKSQGHLETINLIVGWEKVPVGKHKDVKFYFKRQFELEYPDDKVFFLDSPPKFSKFLLHLQGIH